MRAFVSNFLVFGAEKPSEQTREEPCLVFRERTRTHPDVRVEQCAFQDRDEHSIFLVAIQASAVQSARQA